MLGKKEQIRLAYDQLADGYDSAYLEPKDIAENELLRARTAHWAGRRVVDLGCGTGLFTELHNGTIRDYTGLDLSPRMIEHARAKHPNKTFFVHDMETPWPIEEASVDAVISMFAANYSQTPVLTISEMARALIPGGQFLWVLYGRRWPTRHSFVEGRDGLPILYSAEEARDLFDTSQWRHVRVRGLSRWVDVVRHAPISVARAVLRLEVATVLRMWPDMAYFLLVEGQRT